MQDRSRGSVRSGRRVLAVAAGIAIALVAVMYIASRLGPGAASHPAARRSDEGSLFDRADAGR